MLKLGDIHNFNRFVSKNGNSINKPRDCFFESQLLSKNSPLRNLLEFIDKESNNTKFHTLPNLEYKLIRDENIPLYQTKSLKLDLPNDTRCDSTEEYEAIGNIIALIYFLGITDIHSENVYFEIKPTSISFAPIDIECILNKINLPYQTHITNSNMVSNHNAGLHCINNHLFLYPDLLPVIIAGFYNGITALYRNKYRFQALFNQKLYLNARSRVILEATKTYHEYNLLNKNRRYFIQEELDQLERFEIPYFFRFPNSNNVYFYDSETTYKKVNSSNERINPITSRFTSPNDFGNKNISNTHLKASIGQLCKYFLQDSPMKTEIAYKNTIIKKNQFIYFQNHDLNFAIKYD